MKNTKILFTLSVAAVLLCSCYSEVENELNQLDRRITALESACEKLNNNVEALKPIVETIEGYDFVTGITTIKGDAGEVIGYTISFTHSSPITLYNGESAETPIIGVRKNSLNGLYYWTVTYPSEGTQDILDENGVPVAATAVTPQFRIVDGKWQVSYDGGQIWRTSYGGYEFGKATGDTPKSWLSSVEDSAGYVVFNLADSGSFSVPTWETYEKLQKDIEAANNNYAQVQTLYEALKKKLYAKSITPVVSEGDTIGYNMTLSDGTTLSFRNGTTTNRPVITAAMDPSDSIYYWKVHYQGKEESEWLTYSGQKVRADGNYGVTPTIAIGRDESAPLDGKYYWMIKYYDSFGYSFLTCNGQKVVAGVGESVIDSVAVKDDYLLIKVGNQEYRLDRYQDFDVTFAKREVVMSASDTTSFNFSIASGTTDFAVLPVAEDGFYASVSSTQSGKLWETILISPASFTSGSSRLSLIVSDGKGHMKTYIITIKYGE